MSSPRQPAVSILRTAPRWETRAAIDRISALVDVSGDGQDWDIEQADPHRIAAFLTAYESGALDTAERLKVRVRPQGTGIAVMQSVPPAGGASAAPESQSALRTMIEVTGTDLRLVAE